MMSSLAKSKQIIGCALSDAFFLKFSYFLMFLNIQTHLIMLKTDDKQFTLTTKKIIANPLSIINSSSIKLGSDEAGKNSIISYGI